LAGGCVLQAAPVPRDPSAYFAVGIRNGAVQSLGVARSDGSAVLLLGAAARYADDAARHGTFVGASARLRAAMGDVQEVRTSDGSSLLVHSPVAGGRFTVVPPGLVRAWIGRAREGFAVWPRLDGASGDARRFSFLTGTGHWAGSAVCSTATSCTATIANEQVTTSTGDFVDASSLALLVSALRSGR
jgi:hypothetical protein